MTTEIRNPILKTPLSDFATIFEGYCSQGSFRLFCRRIEMGYLNCIQAYGIEKGYEKCYDYKEDMEECFKGKKQAFRVQQMRKEREKQYEEGKLKNKYEDRPPNDSVYDLNF